MKNTNAIDKIIATLSKRDWMAAFAKYPENFKRYDAGMLSRKPRGWYPFSYTLGFDTEEAIEIRRGYVSEKITESEYKAFCLKYNLTHIA